MEIRGTDIAGNDEVPVPLALLVDNLPPFVKVTNSWLIWESGEISISANGFDISRIRVIISDPQGRWPSVEIAYNPNTTVTDVTWDRRFVDWTIAPSGIYLVTVSACDIYGNCASDRGVITVPIIAPIPPSATPSPIPAAAGPDTRVLVFSLHGMGVNHSRTSAFPQMLRRIVDGRPASPRLLKRLRALVPQDWRHKAKSLLPFEMRRRLTSYWRMSDYNWETTRAFSLLSDTESWVRINLKGREARGLVEPGEEYEALCRKVSEGLKTFVDADTGQPLVRDVVRTRDVFTGVAWKICRI